MSLALLLGAALLIGAGVLTLMLLMLRRWREPEPSFDMANRPPALMRCMLPLALLLEPLVDSLLPERRRRALSRQLEALDLAPAITASRWEALCIGLGVTAGGIALLAMPGVPWLAGLAAAAGWMLGGSWLRRQREVRQRAIGRELPAWLDLMTVCVEAGSTLTAGLRLIVEQAPAGPLRSYFERVLREVRGGRPRSQAFSHVAAIHDVESLTTLASALEHAESSGMSLGQVLRAQAEQRTAERFARAEKLAMQAPVKMLGPLILCIFPCTFIVIGVPIAVRLKEALGS